MDVECRIIECYKYHDSENELIDYNVRKLAEHIKYVFGLRQIFCKCDIEKYTISIEGDRNQTVHCRIVKGCDHFYEQYVKAMHQVEVSSPIPNWTINIHN